MPIVEIPFKKSKLGPIHILLLRVRDDDEMEKNVHTTAYLLDDLVYCLAKTGGNHIARGFQDHLHLVIGKLAKDF